MTTLKNYEKEEGEKLRNWFKHYLEHLSENLEHKDYKVVYAIRGDEDAKKSRIDGYIKIYDNKTGKKFIRIVEAKVRGKLYDTLVLEKHKFDSMMRFVNKYKKEGYYVKTSYLNFIKDTDSVFDFEIQHLNDFGYKPEDFYASTTTASDLGGYKTNKQVYFLNILDTNILN